MIEEIPSDQPIESPILPNLSESDVVLIGNKGIVDDSMLTPSTEMSPQNVQEDVAPQVILNTPFSQLPPRSNMGVPKK